MSFASLPALAATDLGAPRRACSKAFLADADGRETHTLSRSLVAIDDQPAIAVLAREPGAKANCSYLAAPELRPLKPADYHAVLDFSRSAMKGKDVYYCDGINGYAVEVYEGYCGSTTSPTLIGAASMVSNQLAVSATSHYPASGQACLKQGDQFHDVHAVRTSGSGNFGMAAYSLMRNGPNGGGFHVVYPDLWTGQTRTIGAYPGGGMACYDGTIHNRWTNEAVFFSYTESLMYPNTLMQLGGPVDITIPNTNVYQQMNGRAFGYQVQQTGSTRSVYVHYARNTQAQQSTVYNWMNTATPAMPLTITSPANGGYWNGMFGPQSVAIAQKYDPTTLSVAIDGSVYPYTSKTLMPIPRGWHTVSIFLTASPQFRHTIRILVM